MHPPMQSFKNRLFIFAEHSWELKLHYSPLPVNMEHSVKVFFLRNPESALYIQVRRFIMDGRTHW